MTIQSPENPESVEFVFLVKNGSFLVRIQI